MKTGYWYLSIALAIVFIIITFTPLVIPRGMYEPFFMKLPRSLWMGILITIFLVILTYIGSKVFPEEEVKKGGES